MLEKRFLTSQTFLLAVLTKQQQIPHGSAPLNGFLWDSFKILENAVKSDILTFPN